MERLEPPVGQAAAAELELQRRDDGAEVGVTAALAVAVHGALHLDGALLDGGQRVGHGALAVVVGMDAERVGDGCLHRPDHLGDLPGQRAAVGVAEHQGLGAAAPRRPERLQGVGGIGPVPVEEVLGVVDHPTPLRPEVGQARLDEAQVLVERGAQHVGHVQRPGLSDDGANRGAGVQQGPDVGVVLGAAAHPARGAEGCDQRPLPGEIARPGEELGVLGVGARPPALDEGHAQLVEPAGDPQLVVAGERDALALRAVPQRGVVDLDHVGTRVARRYGARPFRRSYSAMRAAKPWM